MPDENNPNSLATGEPVQPRSQCPTATTPTTEPKNEVTKNANQGTEGQANTAKALAREFRWVEIASLVINGVLAIAGICALIIYHGQLDVMRGQLGEIVKQYPQIKQSAEAATQSLQILSKQFQLDQRPYVVTHCCVFVADPMAGSSANGPVKGKPLSVNITWENIGRTPAYYVRPYYHLVFGEYEVRNAHREPEDVLLGSILNPGPQNTHTVTAHTLKHTYMDNPSAVRFSDLLNWDGSPMIVAFGRVTYQDVFANHYCTPFFYVWNNANTWGTPDYVAYRGKRLPGMCPPEIPY